MSRLKTAADYHLAISEAREMAESAELIAKDYNDFSSQLQALSLRQHHKSLLEEAESIEDQQLSGQQFSIVLEGKPVVDHTLDVAFMGKILTKIQGLVSAIAAGGIENDHPVHKRRRRELLTASKLQFASSFAGSFGMKLEAMNNGQISAEGFSAVYPTIDAVVTLLESGSNEAHLLKNLAELPNSATRCFESLVKDLGKGEASLRVDWPTMKGNRTAVLLAYEARTIMKTLDDIEEDGDGEWYVGKLDEASDRHGRFGFTTVDGRIFDGAVEPEILHIIPQFFTKTCRAYIFTKEIKRVLTGVAKQSHRLQELEEIDASPYR